MDSLGDSKNSGLWFWDVPRRNISPKNKSLRGVCYQVS
jgi:hypothetical protein